MPWKSIVAMICVTAIVLACIFRGINGVIAIGGASIVSGLGGYVFKVTRK